MAAQPLEATPVDPAPVAAVKLLSTVLLDCRNDIALRRYAEVDMRAIDEIRAKLQADPTDQQAATWVRQIAKTWSNRLRAAGDFRHIRRVLDLLEQRERL